MKPIKNWNDVQEAGGQRENLPAGAYICDIKQCFEVENRSKNGSHLEIMFDICRGDYRGWFEQDWNSQTREDKYWHGIIYQNVPDESSPKYEIQCRFFKRFISKVEASNPGYHWDWNEKTLTGKQIGVVFGEVEKESAKGSRYMTTRAESIISVYDVESGNYNMPAPKLLEPVETALPAPTNSNLPPLPF